MRMVIVLRVRSKLFAGGLAGLLALGAVACEVDDMDTGDPLEEEDPLGDDLNDDLDG
jgi:hypothetical protein